MVDHSCSWSCACVPANAARTLGWAAHVALVVSNRIASAASAPIPRPIPLEDTDMPASPQMKCSVLGTAIPVRNSPLAVPQDPRVPSPKEVGL